MAPRSWREQPRLPSMLSTSARQIGLIVSRRDSIYAVAIYQRSFILQSFGALRSLRRR